MSDDKTRQQARARFGEYLHSRGMRQTAERFAIVEAVYDTAEHFSVEVFHEMLENRGFHVSTATLYNTFQLLCEAGILRRHQFEGRSAEYERAADTEGNHIHLICNACGCVRETRDASALTQGALHTRYGRFAPAYAVLYVYGMCPKCQRQKKKK